MKLEFLTGIILFLFAGASAAATFLPPDHLTKKKRIIVFYAILFIAIGYSIFLGVIYLNPKANQAADNTSDTPTPEKTPSNPVSVWFRDDDVDVMFAPADTPKPHLYLTFHIEVFNSTDETRLIKSSFALRGLLTSSNWSFDQIRMNQIGENTALTNSELKIAPKSPAIFNDSLTFDTGDQTQPSFYNEMQMFGGKFRFKLTIDTDHNETASTTKAFDIKKLKEQMINVYKNAFPDHASQWVTTH